MLLLGVALNFARFRENTRRLEADPSACLSR